MPDSISMVIAPRFGTYHQHPDGESRYHVDSSLAGRVIVFRAKAADAKKVIEVGRHEACRVRIGWWKDARGKVSELTDEAGYPIFGVISRVMFTLVWAEVDDYHWLSRSQWLIIPGGVFVNARGRREHSGAKNGVWLNGKRLGDSDNPEPLFQGGSRQAKIALAYSAKLIIVDGAMDEHTTGWPSSVWEGEQWPEVVPPTPSTLLAPKRQQVEGQIAAEKKADVLPHSPWFVPSLIEPWWLWFVERPTWYQLVLVGIVGALAALWIWKM